MDQEIVKNIDLKIAHLGNFCPGSNGMVRTTVDLIRAERMAGIDAQFVDWGGAEAYGQHYSRVGLTLDGVTTVGLEWARDADILFVHSSMPPQLAKLNKPTVLAMHGRPEYSFELERNKRGSCLNLYHDFNSKSNTIGFVTFWPEHVQVWSKMLNRVPGYVPAMVDLDFFNPSGEKYKFQEDNMFNIILADVWREDVTPFGCLMAASIIAESAEYVVSDGYDGIRIHVFGLSKPNETSAFGNILNPLKKQKIVGETHGLIPHIDKVYRSADLMLTPHSIATRTVREALASGLPIVGGAGNQFTPFTADPQDIRGYASAIQQAIESIVTDRDHARSSARKHAETHFSLDNVTNQIYLLYPRYKNRIKQMANVTTKPETEDPGFNIYNFIAYRPDFKGKDIGKTYNEYMETLPNDEDWACFIDHDAMFTTVDWYNQLYQIIEDNPEYGCFTAVTNRIGNEGQRFAEVDQNNHDILYHRGIGKQAQQQYCTQVDDITTPKQLMSGVVMLVKKSAWKKACGFREHGFLGVDNHFHKALKDADQKVGLMKGVYVYHFYRADDSGNGLKPIGGKNGQ